MHSVKEEIEKLNDVIWIRDALSHQREEVTSISIFFHLDRIHVLVGAEG